MTATLDWFGCSTFRFGVDDLVVFLDAYIDRVPGAPGSGLTADDIDRADWILVGHSHFDHLWGAERIALRTGATVVGSYESIRLMAAEGVPESQLLPVAGGERLVLSDTVSVSVYPSLHSCVWTKPPMPQSDQVCLGDLGVDHQERMRRMGELRAGFSALDPAVGRHLEISNQHPRGDGGALVYLLETPEGSLLYQDTSGHWSGVLHNLRPDVAIVAAAGRGNADGEPLQGSLAQFVARQAWLVRAPRIILAHHDDWFPGFSIKTDTAPIAAELARWLPRSSLVEVGYVDGYALFS